METPDPLLDRISAALAAVPGVVAVALGGSRATGAAHASSDTDIGLYFSERAGLDVQRLLEVVKGLVDEPAAAHVTEVGGWGPWIVGGGWLTITDKKVDLLYRPVESVERVIGDCREGRISMDYQPGHPHGFCSAIWMGEVALCRRSAILRALCSIEGDDRSLPGQIARGAHSPFPVGNPVQYRERTDGRARKATTAYIAGCAFRSLACAAQVLFAVNRRYLINEKGALAVAAGLPLTVADLAERPKSVWQAIGLRAFDAALAELGSIERELAGV